ncbi:hypothetical protein N7462_002913 [Penicillium macrosclerotiorum]|uniref:uncharacterized protein n=1 Tax=Penicillium macrosclerotiorum TaxID=303699 RepID=UPI002546BDA9|nr:uncharacterized protein N7462_002913 [Penicillium macrosclerotiorum]KAJ5688521.1 hypothetical protein N7462_002913 [Penicillium macrosclerotiorum]
MDGHLRRPSTPSQQVKVSPGSSIPLSPTFEMHDSEISSLVSARPYRSKRHRPCDQCRARKLGCQTDDGLPCQRCRATRLDCTFDRPPPKRTRLSESVAFTDPSIELPVMPPEKPIFIQNLQDPSPHGSPTESAGRPFSSLGFGEVGGPSPASGILLAARPSAQFVQSIDRLDHGYAQLFGASSESDPWLLRHCQFDDAGMRLFYKVHYRNAGGVPTAQRIPIHFMISSEDLSSTAKQETRAGMGEATREQLDFLVPPEYGRRLVALFVKYVFPALPVISRSQLGLTSASCQLPELVALAKVPVHLLAAIYASAFSFIAHDDYLCVLSTYHTSPTQKLWRMVYELISEEIHSPRLAVLQAALLYLHQHLMDDARYTTADTPFLWSFVGQVVGLACSLGVHIECRMWGIPAWEKRLRRRLWWAVYAEDKWRSLLMGRPPYIHSAEWDVSELDEGDFLVGPRQGFSTCSCDTEIPFRYLVNLARIAQEIHETFYTLRASQVLSVDCNSSAEFGRMLLEKLNEWYSSLPESFRLPNWSKSVQGLAPYPTSIHFAYLLLVVYVYRAMLRPLARSSSPPMIFDLEEMPTGSPLPMDDPVLDFSDVCAIENLSEISTSDPSGTSEVTLHAAEKCASIMVNFTRRLTPSDFTGFWYSSPNTAHATRDKQLVDSWLQVLRCQSQNHILHHTLALFALGGTLRQLEQAYGLAVDSQRRTRPPDVRRVLDFADSTKFKTCLGKGKYYDDYFAFFQNEIRHKGVARTVNELNIYISGFLHSPIHLGYAIEFDQPLIAAEALALTAVHDSSFGEVLHMVEQVAQSSDTSRSLIDLQREIAGSKTLRGAMQYEYGVFQIQDGLLAHARDEFLRVIASWKVEPSELHRKTAESLNSTVYWTALAQRPEKQIRFDFFLMHSVTAGSLWPVLTHTPWISTAVKCRLLEWKGRADLMLYCQTGAPALRPDELAAYQPQQPSSWPAIFHRACEYADDGHLAKLIRGIATAAEISMPFQHDPHFLLTRPEQFLTIAHMILDSAEQFNRESVARETEMICAQYEYPRLMSPEIQRVTARWPRNVGFEQAWFHVPSRKGKSLAQL